MKQKDDPESARRILMKSEVAKYPNHRRRKQKMEKKLL